ncbi:MAG: hypothetical protein R3Y54_12365 [Eubacteriales bacterium]
MEKYKLDKLKCQFMIDQLSGKPNQSIKFSTVRGNFRTDYIYSTEELVDALRIMKEPDVHITEFAQVFLEKLYLDLKMYKGDSQMYCNEKANDKNPQLIVAHASSKMSKEDEIFKNFSNMTINRGK